MNIDWNTEDTYWKTNYRTRPYASSGAREYDYYRPGYRYGYDAANRFQGRRWEEVESDLEHDWDRYEHRGDARLARALSGFAGPKGNLRFPHDEPLPLGLIARIVRLKVKQDGAKAAAKKKRKSSH